MSAFNLSGKSIVTSPVLAVSMYAGLVCGARGRGRILDYGHSCPGVRIWRPSRRCWSSLKAAGRQQDRERPLMLPRRRDRPSWKGRRLQWRGATLLQRVADSVTKFGGRVLSTQLDVQGGKSRSGLLSMVASCEVDQSALQQILYDLEAGMPFLFVDQLVIQSSSAEFRNGQWPDAGGPGGVGSMAG